MAADTGLRAILMFHKVPEDKTVRTARTSTCRPSTL